MNDKDRRRLDRQVRHVHNRLDPPDLILPPGTKRTRYPGMPEGWQPADPGEARRVVHEHRDEVARDGEAQA